MQNAQILLIEDDPDGQELVATMLQNMQYVVDLADDGEQASQFLFASDAFYRAIIIDLALPGKDGWELLHEILANPKTKAVPCIAVTAFHNSKLREEALSAGFTAYLPKPIDDTRLGRELAKLII